MVSVVQCDFGSDLIGRIEDKELILYNKFGKTWNSHFVQ
jgi:hypothetical protein